MHDPSRTPRSNGVLTTPTWDHLQEARRLLDVVLAAVQSVGTMPEADRVLSIVAGHLTAVDDETTEHFLEGVTDAAH